MSTVPPSPPPPLSKSGAWLLIGVLVIAALVGLGAWLMPGTGTRPPATPAERAGPASPPPGAAERPAQPATKTYTEDEVKLIRDLTRTEALNDAAMQRQYGK